MRNNSRCVHVRLNLNKPEQQKAWTYLEQLERESGKPYNQFIAQAIVDFVERSGHTACALDAKKCELAETCIQRILSAVEDSLQKTLPIYLAGCFAAASRTFSVPEPPNENLRVKEPAAYEEQLSAEEIDWAFLGEG